MILIYPPPRTRANLLDIESPPQVFNLKEIGIKGNVKDLMEKVLSVWIDRYDVAILRYRNLGSGGGGGAKGFEGGGCFE